MRAEPAYDRCVKQIPRPIVILGPTAGGKSSVAAALAQILKGQVIGADSMQVYRQMDAGTAKPTPLLRRQVKHHMIDIVDPTDRFTVADWLGLADAAVLETQAVGDRPVVVGGTNLYIKALLEGLFNGPPRDEAFRRKLTGVDGAELHRRLDAVDPEAALRIHANDHKKLVRALEVYHTTGQPISRWQCQWRHDLADPGLCYRHHPILVGLEWPTEAINRRINLRVKAMFYPHRQTTDSANPMPATGHESLPQEVARLANQNLLGPQASQALGYKQVLEHLTGHVSLEEAFEKTKVLTRRFAKGQRSWLRRFRHVKWIPAADRAANTVAEEIASHVTSQE